MLLRGCWRLGRPLICLRGGLQAPAQSGRRSLVSCIDRKSLPRCAGRECSGLRARRAHCHPWLVVGRHRGHHPKAHLPSPKSASLAGGSPHPVHLAGFPWPPSLSAVSICCAPGPRLLLFHPIPSVVGKPGVRICAPGLLLKPCLSSCLLHRGPLKIY